MMCSDCRVEPCFCRTIVEGPHAGKTLPEPDWGDERVLRDPWSIVCDALIYEHAGEPLPEELSEAAEHAGMILTSMALVRSGQYEIDDMDELWDRDELEWRFGWAQADESLTVEAVFGDGEEPSTVKTTARGLGGRLNEFMLSYTSPSDDALPVANPLPRARALRPE